MQCMLHTTGIQHQFAKLVKGFSLFLLDELQSIYWYMVFKFLGLIFLEFFLVIKVFKKFFSDGR